MVDFINIDQIDIMEKKRHTEGLAPLYVLISGGMGAGKSYTVKNSINSLCLLDIDRFMVGMGFFEYTREQFSKAMVEISKLFDEYMNDGVSIIAMGTASVTTTAINRLHKAKMMGYDTILVHVDAPIKQSIIQNRERIKNGERGISRADEHKIERTSIGAASTVATLRETVLVDYFVYYDNTRELNDG